jgi:hypothetical protein
MLLIVSMKIMILHTDRLLPTCRCSSRCGRPAAARFVIGKSYLGGPQRSVASIIRSAPEASHSLERCRRRRVSTGGRSRGLAAASDLTGDTVMETLAQSFEVREGATPVSVQPDTASPTIPRAYLASNRAAPIPHEKAHFCDGNHGANATIALVFKILSGRWRSP